jgi:hypothetical protein
MNQDQFINHQIVSDDGVTVLLSNPKEPCNMWFRISFLPGLLIIYGDIGEMVLCQPSCKTSNEMRRWALGSTTYMNYVLSKQPLDMRSYEFNIDRAKEICKELEIEEFDGDEQGQEQFMEHLADNDIDAPYEYDARKWSHWTVVKFNALRCFVRLELSKPD